MKYPAGNGFLIMLTGLFLCLGAGTGIGQESEWGENTDYWLGGSNLFETDSMFLGATFLRDTTVPLEVWYNGNNASCTGWLYFMVPNHPDSAYPLFTNKSV